MRKLITTTFVLALVTQLNAQQLPLYSQYYFNTFILNPSHTGIDAGTNLNLVARKQFSGLSNSIGTYAASYQSRNKDKPAGFGLYFYNDNINLFKTNAISGSYAYHVKLDENRTMSFGLALSALDHRYNASNFYTVDENDPVIALLGNEGGITFDGNLGVNFDFGEFEIGIANLQVLQNQEVFSNTSNQKSLYTLTNHWMLNAGYTININDELNLEPFLLYRKVKYVPGQADVSLFLNWMEKGYIGVAYRDGMSFSSMFGARVSEGVTLGYAFDLTTHKLRTALGNTHEVMLKFELGKATPSNKTNDEVIANVNKQNALKLSEIELEIEKLKAESYKADTVFVEKEVVVKEIPSTKYEPVPKKTTPSKSTTYPSKSTSKLKTKPYVPAGANYYLIVGSFGSLRAAQAHIRNLKNKGYMSYDKYDGRSGRHYVHLGANDTKSQALQQLSSLKGSGLPLWVKAM